MSNEKRFTQPRNLSSPPALAVMKAWPVGAWMGTAKAKDRVVTALRAAAPLSEWLTRNVG